MTKAAAHETPRLYRTLWRLIGVGALAAACTSHQPKEQLPAPHVLFVCEHGNVKSLMAASYFNQLAVERGLTVRAISRGIALDSSRVPSTIVAAMAADGFDVADFHPLPVSRTDVSQASRIVLIGVDPHREPDSAESRVERWNDVPAASVSYRAARDALKAHVEGLLQRWSRAQAR